MFTPPFVLILSEALGRNLSDISISESYEAKAAAKDLKEREGEGRGGDLGCYQHNIANN